MECDFGIYTEENVLFLIELKNPERGYEHALEQIINTIELLIKANQISVKELNARIVVKNYPEIPSSRNECWKSNCANITNAICNMTIGHLPKLYNTKKTRCLTAPRFLYLSYNLPRQKFLIPLLQNL